jgi:hypothetical protein
VNSAGPGNPLLATYERWREDRDDSHRARAIGHFAFAVPTEAALDAVIAHSPAGIVELGAGTGYWARLLADRGLDVVAYDVEPPPSPRNEFFPGCETFFDVRPGDERVVAVHADRTLLLVWPTREEWAASALRRFAAAGGSRVVFVGEGAGGRMGDEHLHAFLGFTLSCVACEYRVANAPCVCGVDPAWQQVGVVDLPHWGGYLDDVYLFVRR